MYNTETFFLIWLFLEIGHWLGDYTHYSTAWMLKAKSTGSPLFPIFCHALVHGAMTVIATMLFVDASNALMLGLFQTVTHFFIDVLKGKLNVWFPSLANNQNKGHWYVFGLDQLAHQVVIMIISLWSMTMLAHYIFVQ